MSGVKGDAKVPHQRRQILARRRATRSCVISMAGTGFRCQAKGYLRAANAALNSLPSPLNRRSLRRCGATPIFRGRRAG